MKSKKRLGSIPKGLEWIEKEKTQNQQSIITDEQPPKPSKAKPQSTPEDIEQYYEPTYSHGPGRPRKKTNDREITASTRGLQPGWTRATLIVREAHLKKLRAVAYWERVTIKYLLDRALTEYLADKRVRSLNIKKL